MLGALLDRLGMRLPIGNVRIELQRHGADGGYTNIEIIAPDECHVIVEAKVGGAVAGMAQLERYRLRFAAAGNNLIASLSAATAHLASKVLPSTVSGVPVSHLSWDGTLRRELPPLKSFVTADAEIFPVTTLAANVC